MEQVKILEMLALILGFYMAWNIGANDVANAMGTSVGSKALTLGKAVFLAAILEFSGAFFIGSTVSQTIQKGIVDPAVFQNDPTSFVLGMLGALLATGALLQIASYFALPISTTHSIVGAVLGFGLLIGGVEAIQWGEMAWIALSWVVSPLISGLIAYSIFSLIQRKILFSLNPTEATRKLAPLFVFLCFSVGFLSLFFHGLQQLDFDFSFTTAFSLAITCGLAAAIVSLFFIQRNHKTTLQPIDGFHPTQAARLEKALHHLQRVQVTNQNEAYNEQISNLVGELKNLNDVVRKNLPFSNPTTHYLGVEKIFVYLQIISACLVAFAHGTNDVSNAIGPVAAIFGVLKTQEVSAQSVIPSWLLALGGAGIVIGLATWGWRVIETIGKKITELTPTRGFAAEFGAATTILLASKLGLPISSTHALVGAVFGVGLARGMRALNLQMLREIALSWIVTIPICATFSIGAFYLLKFLLIR